MKNYSLLFFSIFMVIMVISLLLVDCLPFTPYLTWESEFSLSLSLSFSFVTCKSKGKLIMNEDNFWQTNKQTTKRFNQNWLLAVDNHHLPKRVIKTIQWKNKSSHNRNWPLVIIMYINWYLLILVSLHATKRW